MKKEKLGADFIPVAPSMAQPWDLGTTQADKTISPPGACAREASVRRNERKGREEGGRTRRGKGNGVEVAR